MSTREMLSVGIDVGTTTSQMVVSRLQVSNQARPGLVPRLGIDDHAVLYQSEPHLTPLRAPDEVDVDRLVWLIRAEYAAAGIEPSEVETGAVIITGETARTKNAEEILEGLGDLAGDFVVTVAGPNLESQIAGRGSGAAAWSAKNYATVVNVDIGGGSSNAAVFRAGQHVASSASMVGGRQATLDPSTGTLLNLSHSGALINEQRRLGLRVGSVPAFEALRGLTDAMAEVVVDLCLGVESELSRECALSPSLSLDEQPSAFFISGGVGLLYYQARPVHTLADVTVYGDVGPLLAQSLRENERWRKLRVVEPTQTLRATVLGAASQQVSLSGSTIWAESGHLPLRNVPVIEPRLESRVPGLLDIEAITGALGDAVERWDRGTDDGDFALSLTLSQALDYERLRALADGFGAFSRRYLSAGHPLVLIIDRDYAQVLGQTIKQDNPQLAVIVIDQVELGEGDFIDIGEPMFDGRVVPVSVKTLVFYQPKENKTRPRSQR